MIDDAVRSAVMQAVAARFDMRDQALEKELDRVIALVARDTYGQDDGRLAVKIRLVCERDLLERASQAWSALRKIHHERRGVQTPGLRRALQELLEECMRDAAIRLAGALRGRSQDLQSVFSGRGAIDAGWMARQRRSATERQAQSIEDYVVQLPRTAGMRGFMRR